MYSLPSSPKMWFAATLSFVQKGSSQMLPLPVSTGAASVAGAVTTQPQPV